MISSKLSPADKRSLRVRRRLRSSAHGKFRLSVHRSNQHMYAQVIDDVSGITVVAASTLEKDFRAAGKLSSKDAARKVGELIAERALKVEARNVVFDRGQFLYHGRVQALAEGARSKGLHF